MNAETLELRNGLRVCLIHMEGPLFHVQFAVKVGSDNEDASTLQAAHFLEHMVAKFTSSLYPDARQVSTTFSDNGVKTNASTSQWETRYYCDAPVAAAKKLLPLLSSCLTDFRLSKEDLASEAKAVKEEIRMRFLDDVFYEGDREARKWKYEGHVRRHSWEDNMQNVDSLREGGHLERFYDSHYVPNNMCIVVVGPINTSIRSSVQRFVKACEKMRRSSPPPVPSPRSTVPTPDTRRFLCPEATSASVTLSWNVPHTRGEKDVLADGQVARMILTDGLDSRLYRCLRTERGLVYGVHAGLVLDEHDPTLSFFSVTATCRPEKAEELVSVVRRLSSLPITEEESRRAYMNMRGVLDRRSYTTSPHRVGDEVTQGFLWRDEVETEDVRTNLSIERLESGTLNRVFSLLKLDPYVQILSPESQRHAEEDDEASMCILQ